MSNPRPSPFEHLETYHAAYAVWLGRDHAHALRGAPNMTDEEAVDADHALGSTALWYRAQAEWRRNGWAHRPEALAEFYALAWDAYLDRATGRDTIQLVVN